MRNIHLAAGLWCLALFLAACSNGEMPESEQSGDMPIAFSLSVGQGAQARVATTEGFTSSWDTNDTVGIYAVKYLNISTAGTLANSGNHIDNATLTKTSGGWDPLSPAAYYPVGNTNLDFYAYYPRQGSVTNVSNLPFSVKTDQSSVANYKASELLLGKTGNVARSTNTVLIDFSRAMALVEVTGSNYTGVTTVTLKGVRTSATVNLATQGVTLSGSEADISMYRVTGTNKFRALVPPQTIASGKRLFSFVKNGDEFVSPALIGTVTLDKGKVTKYTVNLP